MQGFASVLISACAFGRFHGARFQHQSQTQSTTNGRQKNVLNTNDFALNSALIRKLPLIQVSRFHPRKELNIILYALSPAICSQNLRCGATTSNSRNRRQRVNQKGMQVTPKKPAAVKTHLVVVAHGLVGHAKDLDYLVRKLRKDDESVHVLATKVNEGFKTLDGIASGAKRIAQDVQAVVATNALNDLKYISFVGNSLGGLYVRHAISDLFDAHTGLVAGLMPANFVTVATPHVGVALHTYIDLPAFAKDLILNRFFGQTGFDLNLADCEDLQQCLLYRMATSPEFVMPLKSFKQRRLYANYRGDFMVPFGTAAIESKRMTLEVPNSPAIIDIIPARDQDDDGRKMLEEDGTKNTKALVATMISSLSPWFEKVLVNFPQRLPLSHNKIAAIERDGFVSEFVAKLCGFSEGAFVMDNVSSFVSQV